MEYDTKTFFREHDDNRVSGFTIIEVGDGTYRMAEKWERPLKEPVWTSYWIPEEQLNDRLDKDLCEPVGQLSDEQFEAVCRNTDERALLA